MSGLTRKQYELLNFIGEKTRETGIPPSFDEMKEALDLKSKSGIHRLIVALEERGFVRRLVKRARAIEILRLPANSNEHRPHTTRQQAQARRAPVHGSPTFHNGAVPVPLVGRIATSTPIEALQNKLADIPVESGMLGRGSHYALEIVGDFMLYAGMLDGDHVIVQECDKAQTGEIVVVLVDNMDVMLRRYRLRGDSVALEAANSAYETRLYGFSRVKVQGRIVGLIRRY